MSVKNFILYNKQAYVTESINNWYIRIKNAPTHYNFAFNLIPVLKHKFVTGLINGTIKDRPCEEEVEKIFNEMVDLALKREATVKTTNVVAEVHRLENDFKRTSARKR